MFFLALFHAQELMSAEQSIKSKKSQVMTSENDVMILYDPGNRSTAFDMQMAEPLYQFCHRLLIPIAINTPQWNCCVGNMEKFYI